MSSAGGVGHARRHRSGGCSGRLGAARVHGGVRRPAFAKKRPPPGIRSRSRVGHRSGQADAVGPFRTRHANTRRGSALSPRWPPRLAYQALPDPNAPTRQDTALTPASQGTTSARRVWRSQRATLVALARERRQGLGDGCATDTSQLVRKLLRLAKLHTEVVAVAAHGFNETRLPRSCPWSAPAPGHYEKTSVMRSSWAAQACKPRQRLRSAVRRHLALDINRLQAQH